MTREDKVVLVHRPDKSYISEFEDGTRFTVSAPLDNDNSSSPSKIVIECNGFSRVIYSNETQECSLHFPDDSIVACSSDGAYTVQKQGDYELLIESNGKAFYKIPNSTYILDHTSQAIFHGVDCLGNTFSLQADGKVSVEAPNPIKHRDFDPRYFVLCADSVFELHESTAVDQIISQGKANPKVAVIRDSVTSEPSTTLTTMIEPVSNSKLSAITVSYQDSSIVPYNLRNGEIEPPSAPITNKNKKKPKFGTLVGKGLEIGSYRKPPPPSKYTAPLGFEYRQFLHMQPLGSETREQIHDIVASFIKQCHEQVEKSEAMQPTEVRDDSEVKLAGDLKTLFVESKLGELPGLYEAAITGNKKESFHTVSANISQEGLEFIKKSKAELKAAEDTRIALRDKVIPPYFESKYINESLPIQSPDMAYLTSKLAQRSPSQAPAPAQAPEVMKSQSTLQSSSLTLTLDESESIIQGELQAASSTGKIQIRPAHSTPNHAQDKGTPTEVRPTNPTPMKAVANEEVQSCSGLPEAESTAEKEHTSSGYDSISLDITGQPRATLIPKPAALLGARPGEEPNVQVQYIVVTDRQTDNDPSNGSCNYYTTV